VKRVMRRRTRSVVMVMAAGAGPPVIARLRTCTV
jgi:hypothetical protein